MADLCFGTHEMPEILKRSKLAKRKLKRVKHPRWYRLEI